MHVVAFADHAFMRNWLPLVTSADKKGLVTLIRDYGFGQYRELCRQVSASAFYYGADFSEGDKYINDCASGSVSTGRLTTWRWVGTNHHLEKVSLDTANLSSS